MHSVRTGLPIRVAPTEIRPTTTLATAIPHRLVPATTGVRRTVGVRMTVPVTMVRAAVCVHPRRQTLTTTEMFRVRRTTAVVDRVPIIAATAVRRAAVRVLRTVAETARAATVAEAVTEAAVVAEAITAAEATEAAEGVAAGVDAIKLATKRNFTNNYFYL